MQWLLWGHIFFLETSKFIAEKGSVGKSIVHHGKLKYYPYKHTYNEEYDIDKIGMEKVNFFLKSSVSYQMAPDMRQSL